MRATAHNNINQNVISAQWNIHSTGDVIKVTWSINGVAV